MHAQTDADVGNCNCESKRIKARNSCTFFSMRDLRVRTRASCVSMLILPNVVSQTLHGKLFASTGALHAEQCVSGNAPCLSCTTVPDVFLSLQSDQSEQAEDLPLGS